jgi:catabolite regulation protein CreA
MIKTLTTIEFMRNTHQMSGDPESTVLKNLTVISILWEKNNTLLHLTYVFELVYGK